MRKGKWRREQKSFQHYPLSHLKKSCLRKENAATVTFDPWGKWNSNTYYKFFSAHKAQGGFLPFVALVATEAMLVSEMSPVVGLLDQM